MHAVQRCAIVAVFDAHRQDLNVTSLTSGLKNMAILTTEQYQKLASLNEQKMKHDALQYILLAHVGSDTFHKVVKCMETIDISIAEELQGVLICQ